MLGGLKETRELLTVEESREYGNFEQDANRLLGDAIRSDDSAAKDFWVCLANAGWRKGDMEVGYSFRAAGDLVAAIRGTGNYMDWYCCDFNYGECAEWISEAMAQAGWIHEVD